jgi:hypothetical protein
MLNISRNNSPPPKRFKTYNFGQQVLRKTIIALESHGYLKLYKGFKASDCPTGISSSVFPSPIFKRWLKYNHDQLQYEAFINEHEVLILKAATSAPKQGLQDYADNDTTMQLRENINKINSVNSKFHWSYVPQEQLDTDYPDDSLFKEISPTMLHYKRVFKGDFKSGGRFYCRLQGLSNRRLAERGLTPSRPHIRINGQPTIEIDYKAQHLALCYHLTGLKAPYDGYRIEAYAARFGDENTARTAAKQVFMRLVNTKNKASALNSIRKWLKKTHPDLESEVAKWLLDTFEQAHPAIADRFYSSAWSNLQFIDSTIAESIALSFAADQRPILIVHDSFVVRMQDGSRLHEKMVLEYRRQLGFEPVVEVVLEPMGW